ncbi:hypothetical protein BGZ95_009062 [Linnemannia exigua]|uniref:Uncharacterized protein n=1 Tax=Linnemannia exigua TaxID=604196 RepID=A0AAD4H708_9FUNG|nr:hypothetical protein BGZ95_009062 [Linnemannia exigua]
MSASEPGNNQGRQLFPKRTFYDYKNNLDSHLCFSLDHIFHKDADPISQLLLMSEGLRPFDIGDQWKDVHHTPQEGHADGGQFEMLTNRLHKSKLLLNTEEKDTKSAIERVGFRKVSYCSIRMLFLDIKENSFCHPAVSFRHPAVRFREGVLARHGNQLRKAEKFSTRYRSVPRPGGIEVLALTTTSLSTPLCHTLQFSKDGKWLSAFFNSNKFWLPLSGVTKEELDSLMMSAITLSSKRLCIDICALGNYYTINVDGGIDLDKVIVETMKRADFLLGAFAFGRDAISGALFVPKKGQLQGYKNPILESARLLAQDTEYAAARCQYAGVWLQPTFLSDQLFTIPSSKWWDVFPELEFPKPVFHLTWRLNLIDLFGTLTFYDVPEVPGDAHAEAKVLLRPYQAVMETFLKHGAAWIASEPDLAKIECYAKIFQVLSLTQTSFLTSPSSGKNKVLGVLPSKASSRAVYKHADFLSPLPDSDEFDVLSQALNIAFRTAIAGTSDIMDRAAQYQQLGYSCIRLKKYDSAILHCLESVGLFDLCIQRNMSNATPETASSQRHAKDGMRECLLAILSSIPLTSTDWVFRSKDQNGDDKFPSWWTPLHALLGRALVDVDLVLAEPRFMSLRRSPRARFAESLVVRVLLVRLGHAMLTKFEELQDLNGIFSVCRFMAQLYEKRGEEEAKEDGIRGRTSGASSSASANGSERVWTTDWTSIEQVSREVNTRLLAKSDKADPFKVLEMILRGDFLGASDSSSQSRKNSSSSSYSSSRKSAGMNHPLAGLQLPRSKLAQAELTMDTYFIDGHIAAALACALVLVQDEEIAALSTRNDRIRLWTKASYIAEFSVAQRDILGAKTLVEGVGRALHRVTYRTSEESMVDNKTAMLSYLTDACTMLAAQGCSLLFPKASTTLMSRAHETIAHVHQAWLDEDSASKWSTVAEALHETAKSKDDELGPTNYAYRWLLSAQNARKSGALDCTRGWHAMTATLR